MSLSNAWSTATPGSTTKLNLMTVISGSSDYLTGLDKTQIELVFCTGTPGTTLTANHLYLVSADDTSFIDVTAVADHVHNTTAGQGGSLSSIYMWNNATTILQLTKATDLYEANWAAPVYWNRAVTSTGGTSNNTDGTTGERSIKLTTGATSGSGSTIYYPHLKLNFGRPALFQTKLRIETFSSIAVHTGVGADDITAADSNTRKFQPELCTVTNNNWWLRTANGSANSASDSGVAGTANRVSIDVELQPTLGTPTAYLYLDGTTVVTKTTNIPTSGATADNNIIKHSVKNNTAADRPLHTYGSRLIYNISDNWGH